MKIRSSRSARTAKAALCLSLPLAFGGLSACGPAPITLDRDPRLSIYLEPLGPVTSRGGTVPDVGGLTPLSASGAFTFAGELATGTVTLSALVVDVTSEEPPIALGSGSFDVPVDGVHYARTDAASMAAVLPDGPETLLLAAYTVETDAAGRDIGTVVYLAVPPSAAVTGGTVTLDGESSIAVFGWGPIDVESPEVTAVAVSGTLTFGAVDLAIGGVVEASLTAEFGRAEFDDVVDPPIDVPPPDFVAGDYELTLLGGADARCEGTLSGREGELTVLDAASYGLFGGAVVVAGAAEALSMSGAAIEASFGAASVDASWQPEVGAFTVFEGGAGGVLGLTEEGRYLLTAGPGAETMIGVIVADPLDASGGSFCQVAFPAVLSAL